MNSHPSPTLHPELCGRCIQTSCQMALLRLLLAALLQRPLRECGQHLYCIQYTADAEDTQFYYSAELRGVWAAGVVQFPHGPEYKDGHRMYKIRG